MKVYVTMKDGKPQVYTSIKVLEEVVKKEALAIEPTVYEVEVIKRAYKAKQPV